MHSVSVPIYQVRYIEAKKKGRPIFNHKQNHSGAENDIRGRKIHTTVMAVIT